MNKKRILYLSQGNLEAHNCETLFDVLGYINTKAIRHRRSPGNGLNQVRVLVRHRRALTFIFLNVESIL